jgi:murein DD-endopeptidase MepM/ murein hydrolase activator NlpD
MNIILFTRLHGRPASVNLGQRRVVVPIVLLLLSACVLLIYAGYRLGHRPAEQAGSVAFDWRSDLRDQRRLLGETRRQTEAGLDALALRIGQLQAQVVRMEALGERLVKMAKLDKGEFDFEQPPAQGGPGQLASEQTADAPDLLLTLDQLAEQLEDRERQLAALESLLLDQTLNEQGYPTGRPVERGWLSSGFGKRMDPFTGRKAMHEGVDFAGKLGADVVAVAAGVVTWQGVRSGYGNLIEINHGNGYVTRYGHNQVNLVKVGETVKQGQVIAQMGSSGRSTGPHVHFEVQHHGKLVNPTRYLQAKR